MVPDDREWKERLTAYLDDELGPEEAREVLAWLEGHPEALKEAEEARRAWALLGRYADEPVPDGFADRVLAAVGVEPTGAPALRVLEGRRRWRALAIAASLALCVSGSLLFAWRETTPGPAAPSTGTLAALEAVPTDLLDTLDDEGISRLVSASDEEFEALIAADPQDVSVAPGSGHGG